MYLLARGWDNLSLTWDRPIANNIDPKMQSIPDRQNQVPPYMFSCSRNHFTQIYVTKKKKKTIATSNFKPLFYAENVSFSFILNTDTIVVFIVYLRGNLIWTITENKNHRYISPVFSQVPQCCPFGWLHSQYSPICHIAVYEPLWHQPRRDPC